MTRKKTRNLTFDGRTWGFDFTRHDRRIRRKGFITRAQAEAALVRTKTLKMDEELGLAKPAADDVAFDKFGAEVIRLYSRPNKRSWSRDELSLKALNRFFKGKALADIGPADVEGFKAKRRTEVSDSTTNRELAFLKTIFNLAVNWGKLEHSPAAKVRKFREPAARERVATPDEIDRLIEAAGPDVRPVIITALGTGMRRGEILALKWTDLDFVRGVITIRTSKSGKPRRVPMSGNVAAALGAVPRRGEHVFQNPETGRPVRDVKTAFLAACRRAKKDPDDEKDPGIVGLRFHDLRHTFASRALELGADLVSVSKILGHSSIVMTAKYLHASGESQRLAVEKVADLLEPTRQRDAGTSLAGVELEHNTPLKLSH
jgi:integrase